MLKVMQKRRGIRAGITRKVMARVTPESGDGPDLDKLDKFHYRIEITAASPSGREVSCLKSIPK